MGKVAKKVISYRIFRQPNQIKLKHTRESKLHELPKVLTSQMAPLLKQQEKSIKMVLFLIKLSTDICKV